MSDYYKAYKELLERIKSSPDYENLIESLQSLEAHRERIKEEWVIRVSHNGSEG